MSIAALVDTTRCIGCRACQVACKQENELPAELTTLSGSPGGLQNPPALSAHTFSLVTFHELPRAGGGLRWIFAKRQCMHCLEPACVSACLVEALVRTPEGAVVYDAKRCIGCRYCMLACPFGVPTFEWKQTVPFVRKCTFCADRRAGARPPRTLNGQPLGAPTTERHAVAGKQPACAQVCPTGAIRFGDRAVLLTEARARLDAEPNRYNQHIFGEREVGGTGWLYLAAVGFDRLGFPAHLGNRGYPSYTRQARGAVPYVVLGAGAAAGGLYWLAQRRRQVAEQDNEGEDPR